MNLHRKTGMALAAGLLGLTTACGGGGDAGGGSKASPGNSQAPAASKGPVTLRMYNVQGGITRDVFESQINDLVKKKFPYITLEYVDNKDGQKPADLVAAGTFPDIITTGERGLASITDLGLELDLRNLAKKHNMDLTKFREESVNAIKAYGTGGSVIAIPYFESYYATFYNKDIFDKFGVGYPKDGMTYEEMFELGKKLTRSADGVDYKGIAPGNPGLVARGLSLSFVDPATGKPKLQTDQWETVMKFIKDVYGYPGNAQEKPLYKSNTRFIKDKNIAIVPYYGQLLKTLVDTKDLGFNWDIVSYPSLPGGKGTSAEVDSNVLGVSKSSQHPDDAFDVIQYLTTDEAVQLSIARDGAAFPALKMSKAETEFGQTYPQLKQKNLAGIFKVQLREPHPFNKYDDVVRSAINSSFETKYMSSGTDVVTMLREMEGAAQSAINKQSGQ